MSYNTPTKHDGRAVLFAVAELLVIKLQSMK